MNWKFTTLPQILCQQGGRHQLGSLASELGQRVLLVTGRMNGVRAQHLADIQSSLEAANLYVHHWVQTGEPTIEDVEAGTAAARSHHCDLIIAVGGGSAIDAAKAIGGVVANGGTPLDYLEVVGAGKPLIKPALPLIAVPTTAGAGSEGTRNAVLCVKSRAVKVSMRGEQLRPHLALLDAELAVTVPSDITAATGLDCLTQLIESYTSNKAQPLTDAWALEGIQRAVPALPLVYRDGSEVDAREQMLIAALLGGLCLGNAGLGAVHGFAGPLGGSFPIPHGIACATLLVPVLSSNLAKAQTTNNSQLLNKYAVLGRILSQQPDLPAAIACEQVIEQCQALVNAFEIQKLSHYGVSQDSFPDLVAAAERSSSMKYNPVPLSSHELTQCLATAL